MCTNNICLLCGGAVGTVFHTNWICPKSKRERHIDSRIATNKVDHQHLPDALKEHGWAPKMSADPTVPFWGTKANGATDELRIREHGALSIDYIRKRWPEVAAAYEHDAFEDSDDAAE